MSHDENQLMLGITDNSLIVYIAIFHVHVEQECSKTTLAHVQSSDFTTFPIALRHACDIGTQASPLFSH